MIEREFIPHDRALALKELGFNEECLGWYPDDTVALSLNGVFIGKPSSGSYKLLAWAPLYQQTFRWFRENHSLIGEIFSQLRPSNKFMYGFKIGGSDIIFDGFKTYEEAELACIDKLIELVKEAKEL